MCIRDSPSRIDKSVMSNLSGGTQSHLASALRFLGLVDEDLSPTSSLKDLVDSYATEEWESNLKIVLSRSYKDVIGGVDMKKASPDQLDKCFGNASAVMVDKCARFLLAAFDDANVEYSAHLKNRKPKAKRKPRAPKVKSVTVTKAPEESASDPLAEATGMIEYPIHFSGGRTGTIRVPKDINADDCKMIELVLPMLRMLAGAASAGKE